ncbi:MAG: dual specificity protein phosphatase family protein [Myxococcales bacterium]|nr:dual specificity protein phosphatase family protein [Myxococcales bacterium]
MVAWLPASLLACASPSGSDASDPRDDQPPPISSVERPWEAAPPVLVADLEHTGLTTTTEDWTPMPGFSFVDDHAAGMPFPLTVDMPWLVHEQISLLVSLTESAFDPDVLAQAGIDAMHLPIRDFSAPTLQQQDDFVAEMERRVAADQRVGVHCQAGLGRTGTMLATWFVARGYEPAEAIDAIRTLRPGSIETVEQEESVFAWAEARVP